MMPKNGKAMTYTSGCPKNQKRCCHRIGPPFAASKIWAPRARSASRTSRPADRTGKTTSTMIEVMRIFQEKIGIRNIVMPGVRMRMIVVTKLTAPRMDDKPRRYRPITHRSPPTPGELMASDSGA